MTTQDLQQIDELVHVADVAVRASSELRLWCKRHTVRDTESLAAASHFLEDAARGGRFIATGDEVAGATSIYPLTWSASVRFGGMENDGRPSEQPEYQEFAAYLDGLKKTIDTVRQGGDAPTSSVELAAKFLASLGQLLGEQADLSLQFSPHGPQFTQDRFSCQ